MGPANSRGADVRRVRNHEGLHVRQDQRRSFGALPRKAWTALGIIELLCVVGLIVPAALHWQPELTGVAAAVLSLESLVFIWVHTKYRETMTIVMSAVLGLLMAFISYGRVVLMPIA